MATRHGTGKNRRDRRAVYANSHERARKSTEIFTTTPTRSRHRDVVRARHAFYGFPGRKKDEGGGHEEEAGGDGGSLSRVHMIVSVPLGEDIALQKQREARRGHFRFIPQRATSEKLDAPWPTFARARDAPEEGLAMVVNASWRKREIDR